MLVALLVLCMLIFFPVVILFIHSIFFNTLSLCPSHYALILKTIIKFLYCHSSLMHYSYILLDNVLILNASGLSYVGATMAVAALLVYYYRSSAETFHIYVI